MARASRTAAEWVVAAALLVLSLAACGSSSARSQSPAADDRPLQVVDAGRAPGYFFESFEQMMANSDIAIYGEVTQAVKGHSIGDDPSDPLAVRDVTVRVDQVLYGPDPGPTVIVDQEGYSGDTPFELEEQPWVYPGDHVVYFLIDTATRPPGHYTIVAPGGQIVVRNGVAKTPAEDPIAQKIDRQSWDAVRRAIQVAAVAANNNPLQPLPQGPGQE